MPELVRNGWNIYFHNLFRVRFDALRASVITLEQRLATGEITTEELVGHPDVKLFEALNDIIKVKVPQDPLSASFEQGNTLGKIGKGWRRVKGQGLPNNRHRLFFRFDTTEKTIVFAWLNDETTLRKTGAKSDCYTVFAAMLGRKKPPNTFQELLAEVKKEEEDAAALAAEALGQAQNQM